MSQHPSPNREKLISILKSLSGQANLLTVPRIFVDITGDHTLGIMLSQLIYWSDRTQRTDGFIYKSAQDWSIEVGASDHAVRKFKLLPFVETKVIKANGSPTTHYRVNFDALVNLIYQLEESHSLNLTNEIVDTDETIRCFPQNHSSDSTKPFVENDETLTETTTEITTETTTGKDIAPTGANPNQKTANSHQKKSKAKTENENAPKPKTHPLHWEMMQAISKVTGFDLNVHDLAARVGRVAKQLNQAGYTPQDVLNFETYWKQTDWRWQKSHSLPLPTDIQTQIAASKEAFKPDLSQEERRALVLKELEEYEKQLDSKSAEQQCNSKSAEQAQEAGNAALQS